MSSELTIEQVENGFIVKRIDINPSMRHAGQYGEPLVFNNVHDMYTWMSKYFDETKPGGSDE
jgi:hypothetical protein